MNSSGAKDILVFESDVFSQESPFDERGVQYDLPLGDDIAEFLRERLGEKNIDWKVSDVVREDYGAVLMLDRGKKTFTVTVIWAPFFKEKNWCLFFREFRGFSGWLLGKRPEPPEVGEIKLLVEQVVMGDSLHFQNPRWISESEHRRITTGRSA